MLHTRYKLKTKWYLKIPPLPPLLLGTSAAPPGHLVEHEASRLVTLGPDIRKAVLLLVGNLGVHGVELDGAVVAGEQLLLGVLGPHVLGEVLLGGGEGAIQLVLPM